MKWKLIVGRESRNSTDLRGLFGSVYYNWDRVYAVENTDTGEMSDWVKDPLRGGSLDHEIAFAARQVGVSVSARSVRLARERADNQWAEDHPVNPCKSCYTGRSKKVPRRMHRPAQHRPHAPWASAGGGTPDKYEAEDRVDAIIHPNGKYEVMHG